jgi:hypothetical protein
MKSPALSSPPQRLGATPSQAGPPGIGQINLGEMSPMMDSLKGMRGPV